MNSIQTILSKCGGWILIRSTIDKESNTKINVRYLTHYGSKNENRWINWQYAKIVLTPQMKYTTALCKYLNKF